MVRGEYEHEGVGVHGAWWGGGRSLGSWCDLASETSGGHEEGAGACAAREADEVLYRFCFKVCFVVMCVRVVRVGIVVYMSHGVAIEYSRTSAVGWDWAFGDADFDGREALYALFEELCKTVLVLHR